MHKCGEAPTAGLQSGVSVHTLCWLWACLSAGRTRLDAAPREQMGGAAGVRAAERASITLACAKGMKMICRERGAA
jgi:hypothetical protein